jgi:hypothetical protein
MRRYYYIRIIVRHLRAFQNRARAAPRQPAAVAPLPAASRRRPPPF